ncbi:MAG: flagellar hook-basal body complex protein [Butyrivibrio sp.]|nr:flagellar hook-basal body complex protein [Butyrivibrio sp.]
MMRSLWSAVSGLNTHQMEMDVIGNNISNVNTTAFKSSETGFQDVLYQTIKSGGVPSNANSGSTNINQVGLGARMGSINKNITKQGSAITTDDVFDLMITGDAFFAVKPDSTKEEHYYTRDGSFQIDAAGYLVTKRDGYRVTFLDGVGELSGTGDLRIISEKTLTMEGKATTEAHFKGNIDRDDKDLEEGETISLAFYGADGNSYTMRFTLTDAGDSQDNTYLLTVDKVLDSEGKITDYKFYDESVYLVYNKHDGTLESITPRFYHYEIGDDGITYDTNGGVLATEVSLTEKTPMSGFNRVVTGTDGKEYKLHFSSQPVSGSDTTDLIFSLDAIYNDEGKRISTTNQSVNLAYSDEGEFVSIVDYVNGEVVANGDDKYTFSFDDGLPIGPVTMDFSNSVYYSSNVGEVEETTGVVDGKETVTESKFSLSGKLEESTFKKEITGTDGKTYTLAFRLARDIDPESDMELRLLGYSGNGVSRDVSDKTANLYFSRATDSISTINGENVKEYTFSFEDDNVAIGPVTVDLTDAVYYGYSDSGIITDIERGVVETRIDLSQKTDVMSFSKMVTGTDGETYMLNFTSEVSGNSAYDLNCYLRSITDSDGYTTRLGTAYGIQLDYDDETGLLSSINGEEAETYEFPLLESSLPIGDVIVDFSKTNYHVIGETEETYNGDGKVESSEFAISGMMQEMGFDKTIYGTDGKKYTLHFVAEKSVEDEEDEEVSDYTFTLKYIKDSKNQKIELTDPDYSLELKYDYTTGKLSTIDGENITEAEFTFETINEENDISLGPVTVDLSDTEYYIVDDDGATVDEEGKVTDTTFSITGKMQDMSFNRVVTGTDGNQYSLRFAIASSDDPDYDYTLSLRSITDSNGNKIDTDDLISDTEDYSVQLYYDPATGALSTVDGVAGTDALFTFDEEVIPIGNVTVDLSETKMVIASSTSYNFEFPKDAWDTLGKDLLMDFGNSTNYASLLVGHNSTFGAYKGNVLNGENKGYPKGEMSGISITNDGSVWAKYTNGQSKRLVQIATVQFSNANGLESVGGNYYKESLNSGAARTYDITTIGGYITSGVLEGSNVDLAKEFSDMITTQRGFQANSKVITTSDEMLQIIREMKR